MEKGKIVYLNLRAQDKQGISASRLYVDGYFKKRIGIPPGKPAHVSKRIEFDTSKLSVGEHRLQYVIIDGETNKTSSDLVKLVITE